MYVKRHRVYILSPKCLMQAPLFLVILSKCPGIRCQFWRLASFKEIQKYSTFLLYLLIHNFISPVHHIYKPFLNIYYPIIKVYRSGQFECNCITDLSLNIQPTISLQPLTQYLYCVDRPAHMLSMINGFIVHIHGHVSRRPWYYMYIFYIVFYSLRLNNVVLQNSHKLIQIIMNIENCWSWYN